MSGAERLQITKMYWKSMAFTMNPVNEAIEGAVKIVSAKAFVEGLLKNLPQTTAPSSVSVWDGRGPSTPLPGMAQSLEVSNPLVHPPGELSPSIPAMAAPKSLDEAIGQYHTHIRSFCEHSAKTDTLVGFREHFINCCGMPKDQADLWAHALKYSVFLASRRR